MRVKGNLLFSNQLFADKEESSPVVINLDAVAFIGATIVVNEFHEGEKVNIVFDDGNRVVLNEDINNTVAELWQNYGKD